MTKLVEDPYTQYLTFVISIKMVSVVGTLANYLTTLDEKLHYICKGQSQRSRIMRNYD